MERKILLPCIFLISLTQIFYQADGGFVNEPCSPKNTAHISISQQTMPVNHHVQCLDITGMARNISLLTKNLQPYFNRISKVESVFADHMNLKRFPKQLYLVKSADFIDLSGNHIKRIPPKLFKFTPKVKTLLLNDNKIIMPKKNQPLFKSNTVETLMLSDNNISEIPLKAFTLMPRLRVLYLDGNKIRIISPKMFNFLGNLKFLHVGNNLIKRLPDLTKEIDELTYITKGNP